MTLDRPSASVSDTLCTFSLVFSNFVSRKVIDISDELASAFGGEGGLSALFQYCIVEVPCCPTRRQQDGVNERVQTSKLVLDASRRIEEQQDLTMSNG